MARKFEHLIRDYCARNGVEIPLGFGRNSPSRFAIVRLDVRPPKLVAVTWFKVADVLHHVRQAILQTVTEDELSKTIRILDFQEGVERACAPGCRRLLRGPKLG